MLLCSMRENITSYFTSSSFSLSWTNNPNFGSLLNSNFFPFFTQTLAKIRQVATCLGLCRRVRAVNLSVFILCILHILKLINFVSKGMAISLNITLVFKFTSWHNFHVVLLLNICFLLCPCKLLTVQICPNFFMTGCTVALESDKEFCKISL